MLNKLLSLGLIGMIRLSRDLIISKLLFKKVRIVRWPFYIRNEGSFNYGTGLSLSVGSVIEIRSNKGKLSIGNNFVANSDLHIGVINSIEIGNNVLIASGVFISDHSHGIYSGQNQDAPDSAPNSRELFSKPVKIGDNCWIGEKASILPGVTLGNGVIVGAGSIVTHSFDDNTIIAGNPARVIKKYDSDSKKWITT